MDASSSTRIELLDILRGIAVLGILYLNIFFFGLIEYGYVHFEQIKPSDQIFDVFQAFLLEGRFRSLFCLLFGVGIYIQYQRYLAKDLNHFQAVTLLKTRLKWLFVFGCVHAVFIWSGDILMLYAMGGWYVISKLGLPSDQLIKIAGRLLCAAIFILAAEVLLTLTEVENVHRNSATFLDSYNSIIGNYPQQLLEQVFFATLYIVTFPLLSFCYFSGLMLFAVALFKQGTLTNGFSATRVTQLLTITIIVSSIDAAVSYFVPRQQLTSGILGNVSGLTMALLIWHWLCQQPANSKLLQFLSPVKAVGKLAFTLYIGQSVVMVISFRWLEPQWLLTFSQIDYLAIAVIFTVIQILFANAYLRYFKTGPLELMWRNRVKTKLNKTLEKIPLNAKQVQ